MKINEVTNTGPLKGRGHQIGDIVITDDGRRAKVTDTSAGSLMIRIDGMDNSVYYPDHRLKLDPTFEQELVAKVLAQREKEANRPRGQGNQVAPMNSNDLFAKSGKPSLPYNSRGQYDPKLGRTSR